MAGQTQHPVAPSQIIQQKALGPQHSSSLAPALAFGLVVSGREPGRERASSASLGGLGQQCQCGTAPKSWGLLHLYPGPQQGGLRNVLGPGLGGGKGTHFSSLYNPEITGFANYVGIAIQKALGTRVTLIHSPHSTLPG